MDATKAFAAVSEAYAQYRPTYPPALFTTILDHNPALGRGGQRSVAVDVACGSAQATLPLAQLFSRVVALDACPAQLEGARRRLARAQAAAEEAAAASTPSPAGPRSSLQARVDLRQADAHATGLPAATADLVACAQALHWLDVPRFAAEAARLLKPHGSLAAWSYGLASVAAVAGGAAERGGGGGGGGFAGSEAEGSKQLQQQEQEESVPPPAPSRPRSAADAAEAADAAVRRLHASLADHWDARRSHVDDAYARLAPQLAASSSFCRVETRGLEMRAWRTLDEVVGYVSSWSAVERARAARREARAAAARVAAAAARQEEQGEDDEKDEVEEEEEDPVVRFRLELVAALGEDASLELVTPITLVLACEPRPPPPQ